MQLQARPKNPKSSARVPETGVALGRRRAVGLRVAPLETLASAMPPPYVRARRRSGANHCGNSQFGTGAAVGSHGGTKAAIGERSAVGYQASANQNDRNEGTYVFRPALEVAGRARLSATVGWRVIFENGVGAWTARFHFTMPAKGL